MPSSKPIPANYLQLLGNLKGRIQNARLSTARAVNHGLILLYWDLGKAITEQQEKYGWGQSIVEELARDLQREFPDMSGLSSSNLWKMRQLYITFSNKEFLAQLARELPKDQFLEQLAPELAKKLRRPKTLAQAAPELTGQLRNYTILEQLAPELLSLIPWWHLVKILSTVKTNPARLYYLKACAQLGWSRNVLLNQIKAKAYERAVANNKQHNFQIALPEHLAEQANEMLKSAYNLEFLGIGKLARERDLENKLINHLRDFILELGYGFCFVSQQHRLTLGKKEYFIDLLFYHRFLKALVAIELKIGSFEPEYAGKMDFYLNLLNDKERAPDDAPSIGIILCAEKDDIEVEYALKTKSNPIGVAEYQLKSTLPRELKGKLPTGKQLSDMVKEILPAK